MRGEVGGPCDASGHCTDANAVCLVGNCVCSDDYFPRNNTCGQYKFTVVLNNIFIFFFDKNMFLCFYLSMFFLFLKHFCHIITVVAFLYVTFSHSHSVSLTWTVCCLFVRKAMISTSSTMFYDYNLCITGFCSITLCNVFCSKIRLWNGTAVRWT